MKGAPALTVDVSASDDLDECPIPMTPANKKALQRTALHKAVIAADMSAAERALSEKPTEVHQRDEHGFTPLHNAAAQPDSRARRQLVEMLLNAGADVHAADNEGFSGLHWAAACGHADVLTLLLNAGARPEQRSASGETALHRASRLGRFNEARLLITAAGAQSVLEANGGGETVLDVCGKVETRVDTKNRKKLRQLLLESEPRAAVLVLHHSDCLSHMTGDNHQARVKTHRHRQTQTDTHTHTHTWLIALASLCCTQSVMSRDASSKPPDLWYPTPIPLQAHRHHGDVSSLSSSPRFFGTIVVAPQHALKAAKPYRNSGS